MDLTGIILGVIAAAALLFLLIGMGRGAISLPPLYGKPEKDASDKAEGPDDRKPGR